MSVEDIVLTRRSLIRGVVSRCIEIAENYCVLKQNDESPGTHSLTIVKHVVSGQTAGFGIKTRNKDDNRSLKVFFNGLDIILYYTDTSSNEGEKLWEVAALSLDGSPEGINGVSETPFWENEFEQALKDHIWILTNYNMLGNHIVEDGTSVASTRRAVDLLTKATLMMSEKLDIEAEVIPGGGLKEVNIKVDDEFIGKISATAVGHNISSFTKKLKDSRRVSLGDSESIESRAENFTSSVFSEAENHRHRAYRDSDGNSVVSISESDREKLGEKFDYSDLLETVHANKKVNVALTATEIIEQAKILNQKNRLKEELKRSQQKRTSAVPERLQKKAEMKEASPKDKKDRS